jgi:hypothetical protein
MLHLRVESAKDLTGKLGLRIRAVDAGLLSGL